MLTQEEKKNYVLKHKKDYQSIENNAAEEFYRLMKKCDEEFNKIERKYYKEKKRQYPKAKIYLNLKKTDKFPPVKVDDKYLRKIYLTKNVCHKEEVNGIDIHKYLEKIRRKRKEYEIVLLIRNNKVVKDYVNTSNNYTFVDSYQFNKKVEEEAKKYKASVVLIHNHPIYVDATPSIQDIRAFMVKTNNLKKVGVKVLDLGVVTFDDYFSYKQQRKIANKIINIAKKDGIKNKWVLELLEYTFLTRTVDIMNKKKKYHPNYVRDEKKTKEIESLKTKEYKRYQKAAKEEYKMIIKKYPKYTL